MPEFTLSADTIEGLSIGAEQKLSDRYASLLY
jgi:hypothetical protein